MPPIAQEIKYAARTLLGAPALMAAAVFSLALGIGANAAIFSLVDQILLRLLPVQNPEQLVMIWSTGPHIGNNQGSRAASYPMYQDFGREASAFSYVFCRYRTPAALSVGQQTERVYVELVSGNFFQALGSGAAVGRVFTPEQDDRLYKGHPSVVLSHDYWVQRFNADPEVVGTKVLVNNYPFEIVGVSAPGFSGIDPSRSPQLRIPIQMKPILTPNSDSLGDRRSQWIQLFARMKPGYTAESARASLQPLFQRILREELQLAAMREVSPYNRDRFLKRTVIMEPAGSGYSEIGQRARTALIVLMCMVGLVLLIACFNVANLLIARGAARRKEIAVRLAIGASRAQLLRQLILESLLLSFAGGALGLVFAFWTVRVLLGFLPEDGMALMLQATPDARILAFTFVVAALAGILFGLAPALQALKIDHWTTLKDAAGAIASGGGSVRLRKVLVTAQVALSFLLLAGAGLFVKSLQNLQATSTGFEEIDNLLTFQVNPRLNGYSPERTKQLYTDLLASLRATPGVKTAATAAVPILHGWEWDSSMSVEGHVAQDGEDIQAFMNSVSPGYWHTMGIEILAGRDFNESDRGEEFRTAIVNRHFAEHYFKTPENAVGRRIGFGGGPKTELKMQIVGVVENSLYEGPRQGVHRQAFVPVLQDERPGGTAFYVRAAQSTEAIAPVLRQRVRELDPALPLYELKTLDHQLDETLTTERFIATLSSAFGALATVLAAVGLYGVMAFVVARRTKEIGLRMALGAKQSAVAWMVMREVLLLLGLGLAVAVPTSYALSRYVSSVLFGVEPSDLTSAAAALALLAAVTVAAGLIPAVRASSIDPMRALRYE